MQTPFLILGTDLLLNQLLRQVFAPSKIDELFEEVIQIYPVRASDLKCEEPTRLETAHSLVLSFHKALLES